MYSFVAARRQYGACLPRRLDNGRRASRLVAKAMCSSFTVVVRIDALKELPKSYPTGCSELKEVKEIVLVENLACVLMKSGLARCYDATDGTLLCELNPVDPSAVHFAAVHTLVHNASNNTLIIAYSSLPAHLQCKVVLIEALKEGRIESPTYSYQFECVVLRHPAFFEFCGTNKRIGAADLYKHVYRFWNMNNYQPVFEIQGQGYQEIRVSDGVVVMLSQPRYNHIPISLYDIEDGSLLVIHHRYCLMMVYATRELEIVEHRELQFLELLVTQLLIKQQGGLMRAYDILKGDGFAVDNTMHFRPNGFVFYDTSTGYESEDILVAPQKKFSYRPRRFFTISTMCVEFWELTRCYLVRTRQLYIQGMDNPDLCSHSLWANLLFIHAQQRQIYGGDADNDTSEERCDTSRLYLRRASLRRRNSRVHTPTKPTCGLFEVDIFAPNVDPDLRQGILLFSLDGSSYYGKIDREICGARLRSLSISNDLSLIACGDSSGIVRLVRVKSSSKHLE